jgi:carbon storage regulator CsrA
MLVLSRKTDESLRIGENIEIVVQRIGGGRVRLGEAA